MMKTKLTIYFNKDVQIVKDFFPALFENRTVLKKPLRKKLYKINAMGVTKMPYVKENCYINDKSVATAMVVEFEGAIEVDEISAIREVMDYLQKNGYEEVDIAKVQTEVTITTVDVRTITV